MGPGGSGGDALYTIPAEEEFVMVISGRLLIVVAGLIGRSRPPASIGVPYVKE